MKYVSGRAVEVAAHAQVTTQIKSVATMGKDEPTGAEAGRADPILDAFKGSTLSLFSLFVWKIFFPDYPLHTLKWLEPPVTQPKVDFTYRN